MFNLDLYFLIFLAFFAFKGFWQGLVSTIVSLFSTIISLYLAGHYCLPFSAWLSSNFAWAEKLPTTILFIVSFLILNRLLIILFYILEKFLHLVFSLPLLKTTDKVLGLILGLSEGLIILGLFVYFVERFPISKDFIESLNNSQLEPILAFIGSILAPLLPKGIRLLEKVNLLDYSKQINAVSSTWQLINKISN